MRVPYSFLSLDPQYDVQDCEGERYNLKSAVCHVCPDLDDFAAAFVALWVC